MANQVQFNNTKTHAAAIADTTSGTIYFPTDSTDIVTGGKAYGVDTNTTYSTGTASYTGLTKLYTGTGAATDGTMTQNAITSALSGKAASSHTHNYAGSSSAGGSATSAEYASSAGTASTLGSSTVGSSGQPIYLSNGSPKVIGYTLGSACSKTTRSASAVRDSGWSSADTDAGYVPDMAFIAYWNGAYSDTSSHLAYCKQGAFGTAISLAKSDVVKSLSISGKTLTVTKADGSTSTLTTQDTNTTYSTMGGATASAAGSAGLVPAPAAGKNTSFLRGDGTWVIPTNTTYSNASTTAAGLMSASDKSKLDNVSAYANNYSLPTASSSALGGIKTGFSQSGRYYPLLVDNSGNGYVNVPWTDTNTNTTYDVFTDIADGLCPKSSNTSTWSTEEMTASERTSLLFLGTDKKWHKLPENAFKNDNTVYTLPNASSSTLGGVKIGSNITVSSGTISLTKANITSALGYTPPTADTNTTYSAGTGLSMSGTTINHASSVTAGTAGTSSATSGVTLSVPYCTYNATGHITGSGTHTHTVPTAAAGSVGVVKGFHRTSGTATGTKSTGITTSPAVNSRSSTAGRFYGVETDATGAMYVNVPWQTSYQWVITSTTASVGAYNNELLYFSGSNTSCTVTITPSHVGEVCKIWMCNFGTTSRTVTIKCVAGCTLVSSTSNVSVSLTAYTAAVFEYIYWGTINGSMLVTGRVL